VDVDLVCDRGPVRELEVQALDAGFGSQGPSG